ncbi:hypothetical protein A2303_02345 [Candidatus Falkowbacteria bacterium RIFOXYB2_FULL_47_14]|uniref:Uncharacterized protein n=1 Tax=Candidatus Falkowbacteria bacterium RIFOXYA2_FULL_47_19 TaxID=1797994 RepID=A0A1F5SEN2_9BACT|nr:MAG: hypothetical protein A2227_07520 [Candidatus Falkowbacteria bacterium RIFOXYA2_FULL_47_19]OGF35261.1 MAG: hypothetical protein A2468_01155 [Candidatus Falkowbacteria bacterium RIFOXYC2_FULL_46_15]OGF43903.1 MAG: hypothetical protein A2303_02345 [Candidatus Falkowbacteria bacterium RIFOXYB2_FULL_47_14]
MAQSVFSIFPPSFWVCRKKNKKIGPYTGPALILLLSINNQKRRSLGPDDEQDDKDFRNIFDFIQYLFKL